LAALLALPRLGAQENSETPVSEPLPPAPPDPLEAPVREEKHLETILEKGFDLDFMDFNIFVRIGIAVAIVIMQGLIIRFSGHLFEKLKGKVTQYGNKCLKPLTIKKYRILETRQILNMAYFLIRILRYVVIAFQIYLALPLIFGLFEPTKNLASTLLGYILDPLQNTAVSLVKYIPNLITIIVIVVMARYAIRSIRFFSDQIERGKLVIPGFYPDWARPTFNILRFLLYAFTVIVIYPYLPGSDSAVFQGVSVFVGIIFSLGSSSAIGNLVAGVVITYMRPFKIGDRIKINDIIGYVVEKSATVTRLRTTKNEYVTFPNQTILTSSIINFNYSSGEKEDGLIIYAEVTMGYAIPWRTVHEILIAAAKKTTYILESPKPFVLQTALDDFYCRYEINAYTKEIGKILAIYSDLYQNIQDEFAAANIGLTAPHYYEVSLPPGAAKP
jgi:small-conductance mechanosensitive channel